ERGLACPVPPDKADLVAGAYLETSGLDQQLRARAQLKASCHYHENPLSAHPMSDPAQPRIPGRAIRAAVTAGAPACSQPTLTSGPGWNPIPVGSGQGPPRCGASRPPL